MKKLRFAIFILSVLFLFTACQTIEGQIPYDSAKLNPQDGIVMRTVYPIYDAECESLSVTIENNTDATIEFGSQWYLERLSGNRWKTVYPDCELVFTDILYILRPNAKRYDHCYISLYQSKLKEGRYRILKEINGDWYTAEFEIGDSPITNETPHGFLPLDQLPADYTPEQAAADGAVVLRQGEIIGDERMTAFFADWDCYGFSGQLRVMSETENGWLLTDLIRDGTNRITCITRSLRADGAKTISTRYFGYDHQNNGVLYLSNRRDFAGTDGCVPLFGGYALPQQITDALQADQRTEDDPLIRAWSPDGKICATVGYQGGLFINTTGWGTACGGEHAGKTILDLVWQDANRLMVIAEGGEPGSYLYEFIYVNAEDMKSIHTVSYTYSNHSYVNDEEGNILIPE